MSVKAIADSVFGENITDYIVFDDADETKITTTQPDEDALLLEMPGMQLDLSLDDGCYAVGSNEHPLELANWIARNGDKVFGVYILDEPVDPANIPEDFAQTIPLGVGWKYEWKADEFSALSDLIDNRVSGDEGVKDVVEDVVHEVPVSDTVVAEGPGEPETSGQDSEDGLTEIPMMNDAELLGTDHPDMQALLEKPFTFMTGNMYGQKDRRNTQDGDWVRTEMPLLAWMLGQDKGKNSWGLTRHPVAKSKEGSSIVLADAIDGARKDAAIKTMYAIGLDIDSGAALDDVIVKLEEQGLFALVYTSFSHGKSTLILKHDDIMRKMKLDESPNRTQIQMYLREHHKDRFDPEFIENIQIKDLRQQTPDGLRTVLETPALDKFRVILPLWEPVELSELGATVNQWKDAWADAVTGVAVNMLGVNFDATSCDVNRLFFTPRHPADAEDHYSAVVMGRPLRFEEIEPFSKIKYAKDRDPGDPFSSIGGDLDTGKRERFSTENNFDLNAWHSKRKDRWLAADVIESFCPDKIRESGGEKPGTCHLECPFEHEHTTEGGTATMAMNPDENEAGYWTVFCRHDACNGRDKLEFVKAMVDEGWFEESVLTDEDWSIPLPDEDDPVEEEEAVATEKTPREQAAEFNADSTDDEIKKFMKRQIRLKADDSTRAGIIAAIAGNTELTKKDVGRMWTSVQNDVEAARRARDEENGDTVEVIPVENQWDFGDMVEWGEKRIKDTNAKKPRLFHYIDEVARIEETADRIPRIKQLTEKQFAAELNEITKWHHASTMGDVVRNREVAAPKDVVSQLFSSAHTVYPKLRGLVTTPTFTRDGSLITTPGFHESGLYYWNQGELDVPQVSKKPTAEEVAEAKRLLVEEVFADFPLGGLVRDEIVEQALNGEGVPAITNLISMLLLMFCRDLIDGPTPGHLLTKPTPGTGASLLTDVCSIIANGEATPALPMPPNNEEMQKTLLTLISDGSNIIYFDNIDQSVDSGALASALTAPKIRGRILGKSQQAEAEVRAVWVLCGNNVRLSTELVRRLVMVDLDANMANPEKRSGWRHKLLPVWVQENRGQLVWACLTLVQNWVSQGMHRDEGVILNSYENWSGVMGGILKAADLGGFLSNRAELKERASDGGEDDITLFLDAWWEQYITKPVLMRSPEPKDDSLINMALAHDLQLPIRMKKTADDELSYDPRAFNTFLSEYVGRVMPLTDGTEVKIVKGKRVKNGHFWNLEVTKVSTMDENIE